MTFNINAFTILLILAMPISVQAIGTTDNPEAEIWAMEAAAKKEVIATPAWQKADKNMRERLTEEAVRRKIITTVHSGFDKMQMEVDRKFDELLDDSLLKLDFSPTIKKHKGRIRELFKEELYIFMYQLDEANPVPPNSGRRTSCLGRIYDRAKGRDGDVSLIFTEISQGDRRCLSLELDNLMMSRIKGRMDSDVTHDAMRRIAYTIYGKIGGL